MPRKASKIMQGGDVKAAEIEDKIKEQKKVVAKELKELDKLLVRKETHKKRKKPHAARNDGLGDAGDKQ